MTTPWFETRPYSNDIDEFDVISETPKTAMVQPRRKGALPHRKALTMHCHRTYQAAIEFLLSREYVRAETYRKSLAHSLAEIDRLQKERT